jgi:Ras-related protein Rab-21
LLIFSGQEKFHALGPIYYRQSNGALLVYDITDEDSFVKVKNWVKELKKILGGEIIIVIVGNKTDLEKDRNVPTELAESYAMSVGAKHFETSAKMNDNVEEVFLELAKDMVQMQNQRQEVNANLQRNNSMRRRLVVDESDEAQEATNTNPTRRCCA